MSRPEPPVHPITLSGAAQCLKEIGALVVAIAAIGGAIWWATHWLEGANRSHEAVGQHGKLLKDVIEIQKKESQARERDRQVREESKRRTAAACQNGWIQDRAWCAFEGYPVPPQGE